MYMRRESMPTGTPLNPDATLYETGSREVWQSTLVTSDGEAVGPVIRQVVEPEMYTIRYFVVYDLQRDRHILVPSNTVREITDAEVICALSLGDVQVLPPFNHAMDRHFEQEVYQAARRTPHWIEEQAAGHASQESEDFKEL